VKEKRYLQWWQRWKEVARKKKEEVAPED